MSLTGDWVSIREGVLKGVSFDEYNSYKNDLSAIQNQVYEVNDLLKQSLNKISDFKKALSRIKINPGELNSNVFTIQPKEGLLALYPSYLYHSVDLNRTNEDRIVISANINMYPTSIRSDVKEKGTTFPSSIYN